MIGCRPLRLCRLTRLSVDGEGILPGNIVDEAIQSIIGDMVAALKDTGDCENTMIIVTAKRGQSPNEPSHHEANGTTTPAALLAADLPLSELPANPTGIGPTEDDISLLWLKKGTDMGNAVDPLQQNAAHIGLGEIFYGPTVSLNYICRALGRGRIRERPDIIVTPDIGVTYSNN